MTKTFKTKAPHTMRSVWLAGGLAVLLGCIAAPAQAAEVGERTEVTSVRLISEARFERLIISLENAVQYNSERLTSPDRLYFDLLDTRTGLALTAPAISKEDPMLDEVRIGQPRSEVTRLTLDLKSGVNYRTFFLSNPPRLVVELTRPEMAQARDALSKNETAEKNGNPQAARMQEQHGGDVPGKQIGRASCRERV